MTQTFIISMLVDNKSGVLTRISGLIARRGYNIDSLTVCETENSDYSRMTVVVRGDNLILGQITAQLRKQVDVKSLRVLDEHLIERELLLVKLEAPASRRSELLEVASVYKAKVIDLSPHSVILELTGDSEKINAFIEVVKEHHILELARTGSCAIQRGESRLCEPDPDTFENSSKEKRI